MELSADATSVLRAAGWSPARRVDLSEDITSLEGQGFVFHPVILEALVRFGGLHLRPQGRPGAAQRPAPFHLDPYEAADGEFEKFTRLTAGFDGPLAPIGAVGDAVLAMAPDGRVVRGSSAGVEVLGNDIGAALDRLCR